MKIFGYNISKDINKRNCEVADVPTEQSATSLLFRGFEMKVYINSIRFNRSLVDGPGVRTVIFFQGCDSRSALPDAKYVEFSCVFVCFQLSESGRNEMTQVVCRRSAYCFFHAKIRERRNEK